MAVSLEKILAVNCTTHLTSYESDSLFEWVKTVTTSGLNLWVCVIQE